MAIVTTTHGDMDESLLIERKDLIDNEDERTVTVEYCLKSCNGPAHVNNVADSVAHFCNNHVHRSVHVTLKKNVSIEGVAANF